MAALHIISLNAPDDVDLFTLSEVLGGCFRIDARVAPINIAPEFAYDAARSQYNSTVILGGLLRNRSEDALKVLGVTDVDLFIPVLTFVFGEAQLDGPAAVVSTRRLRRQFYGLPENGDLLQERLEKEAIHEVAHSFGLVHCPDQTCALSSSTYVENIDLKGRELCMACREILDRTTAEHR